MNKLAKGMLLAGTAVGVTAVWGWRKLAEQKQAPQKPFNVQYGPWALVTGAARAEGIGYGFARRLAGQRLNLILVDILEKDLHARAAELQQKYLVKVKPVVLDLGRPDFLPQLQAHTDGLEIGLLVCNHAYLLKETPTILEMDLAIHHAMLDVNARAYTTLIHAYGRQMVKQGHGGIIIVSSQAGLHGTPYTGAYSANKAFQLMLGESLWYELQGKNVDVLVLAPGLTRTQGNALDGYPKIMLMDVDPVVDETLRNLGRRHLVIPGPVNKLFQFAATHLMSREQAIRTTGDLMVKGLGKNSKL